MKKKRTKERKKKERKIEQNMDSKNENGERKKKTCNNYFAEPLAISTYTKVIFQSSP